MTTLFFLTLGLGFALLVVVRAMRWPDVGLSDFELKRRAAENDAVAQHELERRRRQSPVMTLHGLWELSLATVVTASAVALWSWLGLLVAVLLLLVLGMVASQKSVKRFAARYCWPRHERWLSYVADRYATYIRPFRGLATIEAPHEVTVTSRAELERIMDATTALEEGDRQLFKRALHFRKQLVREVMTPRRHIVTISKDEVLGPLTLTALHKVGHSHLPVVHGGLNHIVGILAAAEYMNTEHQEGLTVEDAMQRRIFYINQEQTLEEAVQALLQTRAHLFIVVDNHEKTVGIITISDAVEALFGAAKHGKYQQYEDVHAVAKLGATER